MLKSNFANVILTQTVRILSKDKTSERFYSKDVLIERAEHYLRQGFLLSSLMITMCFFDVAFWFYVVSDVIPKFASCFRKPVHNSSLSCRLEVSFTLTAPPYLVCFHSVLRYFCLLYSWFCLSFQNRGLK